MKKMVVGFCALVMVMSLCVSAAFAASAQEIAFAQGLICGRWRGSDGREIKITKSGFSLAPYTIQEVSNEDGKIVITISVNGGRNIDTLTFENGDEDNMALYNLTTDFSMDYSRIE